MEGLKTGPLRAEWLTEQSDGQQAENSDAVSSGVRTPKVPVEGDAEGRSMGSVVVLGFRWHRLSRRGQESEGGESSDLYIGDGMSEE